MVYKNYYRISEDQWGELKKIGDILEPHFDYILDLFYEYIQKEPTLKKILGDNSISRLKKSQKHHWLNALEHGPNEDYKNRVKTIGMVHEKIGLEPVWYIGGYCFIIEEIMKLNKNGADPSSKKQSKFIKLISSSKSNSNVPLLSRDNIKMLLRLLMFDMAVSITVYEDKKVDSLRKVLKITTDFSETLNTEVEQAAASAEEMSSTIGEIEKKATEAQGLANRVAGDMKNVGEIMSTLGEMSHSIGDVVKLINGLSEQTNLLALNASIEAARAGEHGKGFAVVAEEVRKLAAHSNKSTQEISNQVDAIQKITDESIKTVQSMAAGIQDIADANIDITASVTEQSKAGDQISQFINEMLEQIRTSRAEIEQEVLNNNITIN